MIMYQPIYLHLFAKGSAVQLMFMGTHYDFDHENSKPIFLHDTLVSDVAS